MHVFLSVNVLKGKYVDNTRCIYANHVIYSLYINTGRVWGRQERLATILLINYILLLLDRLRVRRILYHMADQYPKGTQSSEFCNLHLHLWIVSEAFGDFHILLVFSRVFLYPAIFTYSDSACVFMKFTLFLGISNVWIRSKATTFTNNFISSRRNECNSTEPLFS